MTSSRRNSNLCDDDAESNTKASSGYYAVGTDQLSAIHLFPKMAGEPTLFPARFLSRSNLEGDDEYSRRHAVLVQENDDGKLGDVAQSPEGLCSIEERQASSWLNRIGCAPRCVTESPIGQSELLNHHARQKPATLPCKS